MFKAEIDVDMQDGWYGITEGGRFDNAIRGAVHIIAEQLREAQNLWAGNNQITFEEPDYEDDEWIPWVGEP